MQEQERCCRLLRDGVGSLACVTCLSLGAVGEGGGAVFGIGNFGKVVARLKSLTCLEITSNACAEEVAMPYEGLSAGQYRTGAESMRKSYAWPHQLHLRAKAPQVLMPLVHVNNVTFAASKEYGSTLLCARGSMYDHWVRVNHPTFVRVPLKGVLISVCALPHHLKRKEKNSYYWPASHCSN